MMEKNNQWGGGVFCRDPNGVDCIGDPNAANSHRGWLNLNYIYNTEHRTANDSLNRSFDTKFTQPPQQPTRLLVMRRHRT